MASQSGSAHRFSAGEGKMTFFCRLLLAVSFLVLPLGLLTASTAGNTVPVSGLGRSTFPVTANSLKPAQCAALNLTTIVTGSGTFSGSNGNDLILGSADADWIDGGDGNDCILGGGGDDDLRGGKGNDVILGGPGNDNIRGDQDTDVCYGGEGSNRFWTCESTYDP